MNGALTEQSAWPVDRIKDHVSKIGSGVTPSGGAGRTWTPVGLCCEVKTCISTGCDWMTESASPKKRMTR